MRHIKYGKVERTSTMDSVGSKMIQSASLHAKGEEVKTRFEIRVAVANENELLAEFIAFRAETEHMTNTEFRIEHTARGNREGVFYAIKCWTESKR